MCHAIREQPADDNSVAKSKSERDGAREEKKGTAAGQGRDHCDGTYRGGLSPIPYAFRPQPHHACALYNTPSSDRNSQRHWAIGDRE